MGAGLGLGSTNWAGLDWAGLGAAWAGALGYSQVGVGGVGLIPDTDIGLLKRVSGCPTSRNHQFETYFAVCPSPPPTFPLLFVRTPSETRVVLAALR